MKPMLVSALIYVLANAVGLLLAIVLLDGFSISPFAFIWAILLFSVIEAVAEPLITKLSQKRVPAMQGGVALVTTFLGLMLTEIFVDGMVIGGLANWLAATLVVWLGTLIATLVLPRVVFKSVMKNKKLNN
ncbi:MAG: phage holin family protein [Rhodobacteraceae bacterium]|nr:phage holin family protein [Paracoccaceae bacterium]